MAVKPALPSGDASRHRVAALVLVMILLACLGFFTTRHTDGAAPRVQREGAPADDQRPVAPSTRPKSPPQAAGSTPAKLTPPRRYASAPAPNWPPTFEAFARSALNALGRSNRDMVYSPKIHDMTKAELLSIISEEANKQSSDGNTVLNEPPILRGSNGPKPNSFHPDNPQRALRFLKVTSSLALEKIFKDAELARHYASLTADASRKDSPALAAARRAFKRALEQVIISITSQQYTAIEFMIAATPRDQRESLKFREEIIRELSAANGSTAPADGVMNPEAAGEFFPRIATASSLFALDHWGMDYLPKGRSPVGDLWIGLRPHLECTSSSRTCSAPYGCTYQCNPEYLVGRRYTSAPEEESLGAFADRITATQGKLHEGKGAKALPLRVAALGRVDWVALHTQLQQFASRAPSDADFSVSIASCAGDVGARAAAYAKDSGIKIAKVVPTCHVGEESLDVVVKQLRDDTAGGPTIGHAFLRHYGVEIAAFSRWARANVVDKSTIFKTPGIDVLDALYWKHEAHEQWNIAGQAYGQTWLALGRALGFSSTAVEPHVVIYEIQYFTFVSHVSFIISESWLAAAGAAKQQVILRAPPRSVHPYVELINNLLDALPVKVRKALYDPSLFDEVLTKPCPDNGPDHQGADSEVPSAALLACLLPKTGIAWQLTDVYNRRPGPIPLFASPFAQLRYIKTMLSLGIGRLHRDKHLADQYAALLEAKPKTPTAKANVLAAQAAFEEAVRKVIAGYVRTLENLLEVVVEGTAPASSQRLALSDILDVAGLAPHNLPSPSPGWAQGVNPVNVELNMGHQGPPHGRYGTYASQWRERQVTGTVAAGAPGRTEGLDAGLWHFVLAVDVEGMPHADDLINIDHSRSATFSRKFWSRHLPLQMHCLHTHRTCSSAEGCRRLCNPSYTFYGGAKTTKAGVTDELLAEAAVGSSTGGKRRALHIVGYGSNDEYEWEDGMILVSGGVAEDVVARVRALDAPVHGRSMNVIDTITSFDCTVKTPHFSDKIRRSSVRFGLAPVCVGDTSRPTDNIVRQGQLREYLSGTAAGYATVVRTKSPEEAQPMRQTDVIGDATFSQLSVLKMDAEGFEHVALPEWVRTDMRNIAASRKPAAADGKVDFLVDFEAVPGHQVVSQFQLELHRVGFGGSSGTMYWAAAWNQFTLLHLNALGFLLIGSERNFISDCCEEVVYGHYRHIILSEAWMDMQ